MIRRMLGTTKSKNTTLPTAILAPGTPAPDFSLPAALPGGASASERGTLSLDDLRGKPAIMVFYPADWSPVCGDQLALYNDVLPMFAAYDAQLVGLSVDGVWCHKAYADARGLSFPLLADFEPKGAVARQYGVYERDGGMSQRALFVLDAAGVIRWSYLSPANVNPGADGILKALETL